MISILESHYPSHITIEYCDRCYKQTLQADIVLAENKRSPAPTRGFSNETVREEEYVSFNG